MVGYGHPIRSGPFLSQSASPRCPGDAPFWSQVILLQHLCTQCDLIPESPRYWPGEDGRLSLYMKLAGGGPDRL